MISVEDGEDHLPSSLDLYEPNGHSRTALTCEKAPNLLVLDVLTRSVFPARCRLNGCPLCLPVNARRRMAAIVAAGAERLMTLTLAAEIDDETPVVTARIRMKRLRQAMGRKGLQCGEWTWTLEKNPENTGYHAHCVQRGAYIPQQQLAECAAQAGFGRVADIRKVKSKKDGSWYVLKGFNVPGYMTKGYMARENAMEALAFNGNRIERHTREFFWINGIKMGVRDAERHALSLRPEHHPGRYWVGRPEAIERLLSADGNSILAVAAKDPHSFVSKPTV